MQPESHLQTEAHYILESSNNHELSLRKKMQSNLQLTGAYIQYLQVRAKLDLSEHRSTHISIHIFTY